MSYGGNPSTSTTDAIRLKVGDTGTTSILSDTEYTYFYSDNGSNVLLAAAAACEAIAAKYAPQVNQSHGDGSLSLDQLYQHYLGLAEKFRAENSRKTGIGSITAPSRILKIRDSVGDNMPGRMLPTDIQPEDYDTEDEEVEDLSGLSFPAGISDGAAAAYANWYNANFLKITYTNWTLFSGVVAASLTPITAAPTTEDFKLSYLATSAGTVVVTGSKDGAPVIETVTLQANVLKLGTKSFDATPSSITCTCPTGTIAITCIDQAGQTMKKETTATVACKWEDYTKKWEDGSVTDARVFCQSSTIKTGDMIRFNRAIRGTPTNGDDYQVMALRDKRNPATDALLFVILYVK